MLEELDSVDWGRLTHAYGEAADVPSLVRALCSNDAEERHEGLGELFGTIWHQGTVYEATASAVPFLIELLANPGVEGKDGILQLLACIAEGRSYLEVHAGPFDRMGMGMGPAVERERADHEVRLARELAWVRAAREAVEAGVGTYLDLLADDEPEVRIFAAYALSRCRGRAAQIVDQLIARIPTETDDQTRAALILAVGSLEAAVDQLGDISRLLAERIGPKECPVVRLAAAMGLAGLSSDEPAPKVLDTFSVSAALARSDFERLPWCEGGYVAISVGETLAGYPEARLRFVLGLLDNRDEEVRKDARYAIEALCHERRSITPLAAAALGERVPVGDSADRRGTVKMLSCLGSAAAVALGSLSAALDDDDQQIRTDAAVALAILRDPRAIPVLIALLNDDHSFPKIAEALGGFGAAAKDAVPALVDVLGRNPPRDRILAHNRPIQVAAALGRIGPEARPSVPALIALMKEHSHTCQAVTLALGQIGGPEVRAAIPIFTKLLRSQDELVRIRAAQTLWQIDRRADQVLPVLIELLQPGGNNRSLAAEVLGEMGTAARDGVPALRACLEDRSFHSMWVKLQAARAIWRIDGSADRSLPVLVELLCDPGRVGACVATQAVKALGEMGALAREAIPVLGAALAEDVRPFGGIVDEIVIRDEAFCSAVVESIQRIERSGSGSRGQT